jgi:primosomal replication protein N''
MPIRDISDMLSTQRKPAIPRDYLQGYMEYARAMSNGELPAGRALLGRLSSERAHAKVDDGKKADGFANDVLRYIHSLGFSPVSAHEGDAFGLDFAIADPESGLYAIGIECDAPRHACCNGHGHGHEKSGAHRFCVGQSRACIAYRRKPGTTMATKSGNV